ncbi:PTS sugar transporter subunit IIA [Alkaliphilus hydrothermalis]|uniref:PTS system nitrogen regulatory IIA component n=1 Tax=Alkaliphilus hydrothermalis TaxID=1482730 RepID=A0ABS2NNB5_9FIRM|nr:fructose PTS transporter subunit IIA [Alkaliphilus hydrothermalis]MBM7614397.1 PTS system nitrogen regulatory IIA component [Alkaliphilus hydrothermalis]
MEIKDVLNKKLMILDLQSSSKEDVVMELVKPLVKEGIVTEESHFIKTVMDREAQSTTGIGMGIAIPHGKSSVVTEPSIVFGKSQKGIDYEALDGEPSYIFFLIAVPENSDDQHLRVLSQLSRSLMSEEIREKLLKATSEEEVLKAFQ